MKNMNNAPTMGDIIKNKTAEIFANCLVRNAESGTRGSQFFMISEAVVPIELLKESLED